MIYAPNYIATWFKGFKPTDNRDVFLVKIFLNANATGVHADVRLQQEIPKFIKDNRYTAYEVLERLQKRFPRSYIKYKIKFSCNENESNHQHDSDYKGQAKTNDSGSHDNPNEGNDPYSTLNVSPDTSWDDIYRAYKKMAQMYHPDKVVGLAPEYKEIAEKQMRLINAALEVLKSLHGR